MTTSSFVRRHFCTPFWICIDRSPRLRYMRELEKSQYDDLQDLKEKQFARLKEILDHAYNHTVYYRKLFDKYGIHPKGINDLNDFKKIPILTKEDIQNNSNQLISNNFKKDSLIPFKTGGSTGKSLTVYKDFWAIELAAGSSLRSFKWAGWNIGEPWGRVWGNPPKNQTLKEKIRNLLLDPQIFLDTMNLTDKTMNEFYRQWEKTKPTIMHGHSHSLAIFAHFCINQSINSIRPKGIISTSMMLMPSEREAIERAFECKVTDLYGCEEVGLIACECEQHQGMHLNMENLYAEFINAQGDEARPGEEGAIIATSLINKAMPLIRYKIEDVGSVSKRRCNCGRTLPLMEEVSGRVADFLVRKDGSLLAGVSLVERTLTAIPGIKQMQIIQEDINIVVINLVKGDAYTTETEKTLISELNNSLDKSIKITIRNFQEIKPEPSGKYRFAISKVTNPYSI